MKKTLTVLFFLLNANLFSQTSVFTKKYNFPSNNLRSTCIVPAFDKGLVFAGYTEQNSFVAKTDSVGNVAWSKHYTISGNNSLLLAICRTSDSCYAVAGNLSLTPDLVCMKLKKNGDTVWVKKIVAGGSVMNIQSTLDKGFVITGHDGLAVVTKIDSLGNLQWKKRINSADQQNRGITTKQLPDSSFVVLVYKQRSYNSSSMSDAAILNLSKTGNVNWAKSYNKATLTFNWGLDMEVIEDGIMIFVNASVSTNPHVLLKTDLAGNVVWCKSYGGTGVVGSLEHRSLKRTKDKGFIFGMDKIIKTDSIGMPQWINSFNNPQPHNPYEFAETKNKTIASVSYFFGSSFTGESHVITMDSLGAAAACTQTLPLSVYFESWAATSFTPVLISGGSVVPITATIAAITVSASTGCPPVYPWSINEQGKNKISLEISPNPSEGIFNLKINKIKEVQYFISDVNGKQIAKGNCEGETLINISHEANGVYLLHILDNESKILDSRKLIKK